MSKIFYGSIVFLFVVSAAGMFGGCRPATSENNYVLVGTYNENGSKGIYVFSFNLESGEMKEVSTQSITKNPSYLTTSKDNVYAVSETSGDKPGSVSAYRFNRSSGKLNFINSEETGGDDPCYIEFDKNDGLAAVANYTGGSVSIFKTNENGALLPRMQLERHEGKGVDPERQAGPHVHASVFSPDGKFLLTTDLGTDKVSIYKVDNESEKPLSLYKEIKVELGAGPRHIIFHPTFAFVYLINEMIPFLNVYSYTDGDLTLIQQLKTWPENFSGIKDGAAIKISPNGKFLYVSHRGDMNTIDVYSINPTDGKVNLVAFQSVSGVGPRDFDIDPTGKFLAVANYETNNIVMFRINAKNGELTESSAISVPVPVGIRFIEER